MKQKYSIGTKFRHNTFIATIIAYGKGYYMARISGAFPFVISEKDLELRIL
jgi:hypothetical protein